MSTVSSGTDPGHADDAGEARDPAAGQARDPAAGETWVALLHRPGPAAPQDASLFADPRFGAHVQFLSRMREASGQVDKPALAVLVAERELVAVR